MSYCILEMFGSQMQFVKSTNHSLKLDRAINNLKGTPYAFYFGFSLICLALTALIKPGLVHLHAPQRKTWHTLTGNF